MTPEGINQLQSDEGLRLKPYEDTVGKLTIGYGRNLTDVGISADEAYVLFHNDVDGVENVLMGLGWFQGLDPTRRDVVVNMGYNLGIHGLLSFHNMILALGDRDWQRAKDEMLDSRVARMLPERYGRLAKAIEIGSWQGVD